MPNSLTTLTDGIVDIGNMALSAATTRHRHSTNLSSSALPVPPPPLHTNVAHHPPPSQDTNSHQNSNDTSHNNNNNNNLSPSTASRNDSRRNSQVGLSAEDGQENNMTIEFDGGTHVIVRPNRIIRGKVVLAVIDKIYVTRIRVKVRKK
jgi:hypothetical protein